MRFGGGCRDYLCSRPGEYREDVSGDNAHKLLQSISLCTTICQDRGAAQTEA